MILFKKITNAVAFGPFFTNYSMQCRLPTDEDDPCNRVRGKKWTTRPTILNKFIFVCQLSLLAMEKGAYKFSTFDLWPW
jgi:hypothetical protein